MILLNYMDNQNLNTIIQSPQALRALYSSFIVDDVL